MIVPKFARGTDFHLGGIQNPAQVSIFKKSKPVLRENNNISEILENPDFVIRTVTGGCGQRESKDNINLLRVRTYNLL